MDKNKRNFKKFIKSFGYAFEGICITYKNELNIKVMTALGILAIILSFVFKISYTEKLVILLLITIIIPMELINTAIEKTVDLHDGDKKSTYGKLAKDAASGGLLVASSLALIIGIIIFIPYILKLF